jgi:site-specific DNA-methyltransferase (adenine-specific)
MTAKTTFSIRGRNPDVLTCIANLSNDEVFTPPEFANKMLDSVAAAWASANGGEDIFSNTEIKFLDPFAKSGVFLREITSRLTKGLEDSIPDLNDRVDHILTKQVFGIGVTELTSQLSRRSLYCSKLANGEHSIAKSFTKPDGNIWFERTEHFWAGGTPSGLKVMNDKGETVDQLLGAKCKMCGASKSSLDRGDDFETHAYALLHTDDINKLISEIFGADMHFDVIIGNPPYQLSTGSTGGAGVQAKPIYNQFVEQAKTLDPRYLCMVTPSRWFSGGMGLENFRQGMLQDNRLRVIHDFPDSSEVFPGTQIKGGVSYFLWDRDTPGLVSVSTYDKGTLVSNAERALIEEGCDVFIRYNEGVAILKKVMNFERDAKSATVSLPESKRFMSLVSSIGAFGLDTRFQGRAQSEPGDIQVFRNGGVGYVSLSEIPKEQDAIKWWKVFIARAGSGSDSFPHSILGKPFVGAPGTASSWTYMHIGPFKNQNEAENARRYIATKFFRFLVLLHKPTQDATRSVYSFVPKQDFSKSWTDEILYEKYGIDSEEQNFIDSMIRPMELEGIED